MLAMDIKHILLTTDLSGDALRPFQPVLKLAKEIGAKVTVLHVVQDLVIAPHGAPLAPPISAPDISSFVEAAKTQLADQCQGLEVEQAVVRHESPAKGVVEYAEEHDVDLIALSSHGRTGFRRFALGSVAETVLRRSPIPVLSFHRTEE